MRRTLSRKRDRMEAATEIWPFFWRRRFFAMRVRSSAEMIPGLCSTAAPPPPDCAGAAVASVSAPT
eukprot:5692460-Alexandrium_andersonii.AAC.1